MQVYLVLSLVFAVFVAAFAVQNTAPVTISLLLWQFHNISLVLVILCSAAIGALCVFMLGMVKQVSQRLRIRELEGENKKLVAENTELKEDNLSLKSQQANDFSPDKVRDISNGNEVEQSGSEVTSEVDRYEQDAEEAEYAEDAGDADKK